MRLVSRLRSTTPATFFPVLGFCIVALILIAGAHIGFRMADDGYLWYGAQRTLAGEIPLRDFNSYDPARYYLVAAVMAVLRSHGMVEVNIAAALAGAAGVWLVLRALYLRREGVDWWLFPASLACFLLWMVPRANLFDSAASMTLVVSLAWMLAEPTSRRCFIAGLCLGGIAIVRRDHGLYGAVAEVAALAFLAWGERRIGWMQLLCWSGGVLAGYLPMLLAMLLVPGFWSHFWATLHVYVERGTTNNPLPIPWPWRVMSRAREALPAARFVTHGTLLLLQPLAGLAVVAWAWRLARSGGRRVPPLLLACGLLAIPYAHHAFARADLAHFAQGSYPMLIGVLALSSGLRRNMAVAAVAGTLGIGLLLFLPLQPSYQAWQAGDWVEGHVGPDQMQVSPRDASELTAISSVIAQYAPGDHEFVAAPLLSGAYAIADRPAAVWDTYAFYAADATVQGWEIGRIQAERPSFILIQERGEDGTAAHGYPQTHPQVFEFIREHYARVEDLSLPAELNLDLYVPSGAGSASPQKRDLEQGSQVK